MQVIINGRPVHYVRAGTGRAILILPGWADTSQSWLNIQKKLSAGYDCIVLDLPGFGGSAPSDTAWDLDDYVTFISQFLQKIGIENVYGMIGHSNGGAMAIRGLGSGKLAADKLALIASAGIRQEQNGRRRTLRLMAKTGKALTILLPPAARRKLRKALYKSIGSDMLVAEHMQETFKKIVVDDVQKDAAAITVPTLLVYGDADTETPLAFGQVYHGLIEGSTLEVIGGAGHFLHVDHPDKVAREIGRFLE
jgi:pimeloyl-ACP methyl ester carboxylesterase